MVYSAVALWLPLLTTAITALGATNDWTKPCFQGECSYDLPQTGSNTPSGALKIWGSVDAISDITTAGGWTILGCSPTALSQDIRLVCNSDDTAAAGCDHLYKKNVVGKLVRLPENCGKNAFARVGRAWDSEDQTIPASIAARLVRRDGAPRPKVRALALDTEFAKIDTGKTGNVNIAIQAINAPGVDFIPVPVSRRRRDVDERAIGDFVNKAGTFVKDAVTNLNNVSANKSVPLAPISVNKSLNLINQKVSCGAVSASVKADVVGSATAQVTVGVVAAGTLVPPKLTAFSTFVDLTANLNGNLIVAAVASGTIDSGVKQIFQVGIPGISFPGVLTLGPSFKVTAQAKASLDANVDLNVGLNYRITSAKLVFPPSSAPAKGGAFTIGDTPLTLSASPSIAAKGTVEAHIIPTLDLGIDALGGVAKATIFLNLDSSATLVLNLNAAATAQATVTKPKRQVLPSTPVAMHAVDDTAIEQKDVAVVEPRQAVSTSASASFGGCATMNAGFSVNAGANANFFGLFDKSTKTVLFQKKFELFKKCFGSSKRSVPRSSRNVPRQLQLSARALLCPGAKAGKAQAITSGTVRAAAIKSV